MIHQKKRHIAFVLTIIIILFGLFKYNILKYSAFLIRRIVGVFNLPFDDILNVIRNSAENEALREQAIGWIIYYPLYLSLHISLIYFVFKNNRIRLVVISIVLVGVSILVFGWAISKYLAHEELAHFFKQQFNKLFSLPFILFAIEGGRILMSDISKKFNRT